MTESDAEFLSRMSALFAVPEGWQPHPDMTRLLALAAEAVRLREALGWYARTFCEGPPEVCGSLSDVRCSGCKARAALSQKESTP